jgi:hypothetical protein
LQLSEYLALRARVSALEDATLRQTDPIKPPQEATDFALRTAYVILNGGMSWRVAKGIWSRMRPALVDNGEVGTTFNHAAKRASINAVMTNRDAHFTAYRVAAEIDSNEVIAFCETLPHIGPVTKFHLAKNLGVDCAKPDIWLVRVAAVSGESPHELCTRLSQESGDRIAEVDFVIWRACQQRLWTAPTGDAPASGDAAAGDDAHDGIHDDSMRENDDDGSV